MNKEKYYACFKYRDGHVERKSFNDRRDAHKYISDNWDELEHVQAWIEWGKIMYYACLELREKTKDSDWIVRIPFSKREDARKYIEKHFDPNFHSKAWTE